MKSKNLILMVVVGVFALAIYGCSQLGDQAAKTSVGPSDGLNANADSLAQIAEFEAQAARYELWISKMDPYVTKAISGEYVFDEASFRSQYASCSGADQKVVDELISGIPIVNQKIRELVESNIVAKIWFVWYWWGYKECYSELSAINMLATMQISPWGYPLYYWAQYYYYYYGYFCIGHTWAGGIWITR